jgi:GMP synthase (glutamine-hydrolysing)
MVAEINTGEWAVQMRKILVFQHVAHEPLGTLDPLLKSEGFRIRYVNFQRDPGVEVSLDGYNGLIVLGGPMGVYEAASYPHLRREMRSLEDALKREIPVLGICLGSQLLAEVLGGKVHKGPVKEIGWYDVKITGPGKKEGLFEGFAATERIFQLHGDTFDVPAAAVHLAEGDVCPAQAFRYKSAYGLQFHLEVDRAMIQRWLKVPSNRKDMESGGFTERAILEDTDKYIHRSLELSRKAFLKFTAMFEKKEKKILLGSGHGKNRL